MGVLDKLILSILRKEKFMKKKSINFTVADGHKPNRHSVSGVYHGRAPYEFTLEPGEEKLVKLGVSCNYPLMISNSADLEYYSVDVVNQGRVILSGQDIPVHVKNCGKSAVRFRDNDQIVMLCPLNFEDFEDK